MLRRHFVLRSVVGAHSFRCRRSHASGSGYFNVMRPDGVTQRLRHQTFLTETGDGVSHPVCLRRVASRPPLCGFHIDSDVQCHAERASFPAPQRESVERSTTACGASLNVWSSSHRFENVERIIFAASRASDGNTRSAASAAWSRSHNFSTCGGDHICIQQTSWQLSAGHRVNVPAVQVAYHTLHPNQSLVRDMQARITCLRVFRNWRS